MPSSENSTFLRIPGSGNVNRYGGNINIIL